MDNFFQLKITPRDVLFFRDAKPMEGSWVGQGCNWPQGGTLHGAFLAALQRSYKIAPGDFSTFGNLRTIGPFPQKDDAKGNSEMYYPTPMDLLPDGSRLIPSSFNGENNLPAPLKKVLKSTASPTKKAVPQWLSQSQYRAYLDGKTFHEDELRNPDLYRPEARPGIAINQQTRSTEKGKFYSAEYLRFEHDTGMSAFVRLDDERMGMIEDLFRNGTLSFQMGGQQCCVYASMVKKTDPVSFFSISNDSVSDKVKWILLTPACWKNGWCPDFVDMESGRVMLKSGIDKLERLPGELREQWRTRKATLPDIDATLVAARVGSAQLLTGWKMGDKKQRSGGPRAVRFLVPAGSVFYFETSGQQESLKLISALTGKFFSITGGEYGYGLGVCAPYIDDTSYNTNQ